VTRPDEKPGDRLGRYTVMGRAPDRKGNAYLLCRCDCGTVKRVQRGQLRGGYIVSCGCHRADLHEANPPVRVQRDCEACGRVFEVLPTRATRFCSRACGGQGKRKFHANPLSVAARFWAYVERGPGCWRWTGPATPSGYGKMRVSAQTVSAHRLAWRLVHGEEAPNLVCHKCDNKACVRPSHLFSGTHTDNMRDMVAKGRGRWDIAKRTASR
jgi:hypothetical protein